MGNLVEQVADLSGRKAPKRELPVALMKLALPIGPLVGKMMGFPPNLRELIQTSDGVTLGRRDDKARRELGYAPRELRAGLERDDRRLAPAISGGLRRSEALPTGAPSLFWLRELRAQEGVPCAVGHQPALRRGAASPTA